MTEGGEGRPRTPRRRLPYTVHVGPRRWPLAMSTEDHYQNRYYEGLINRLFS